MTKPDFSGRWTFNRTKSVLQIPPPDASIFEVTHREPNFRLSRTHVYGGKSDTFSLDLITEGREIGLAQGDRDIVCHACWENDGLLFDSQISKGAERARNTVRYKLSEDRQTIVAEEQFRSDALNYDNLWVLDRT